MNLRIGINGFGRIGRTILRLIQKVPELEVVHINDISTPGELAHLFKYDSVQGVYSGEVQYADSSIIVSGKEILSTKALSPAKIEWGESGTQIVLECSGRFRDRDSCLDHLKKGPKKVIVSAPAKGDDVTLVMGVNHKSYDPSRHNIISNASCTTNCLAPVIKILNDRLGIINGYMTTIHSYTNDQRLQDGPHSDPRRSRAGALNQIPTTTGAARAIGLVLPELDGKLEGMSIRVPTPNVSLIDLVVEVEKETDKEKVNNFFEEESRGELKGYLDISYEPLVSCDYNGSKFSAVVDGLSTNVMGKRLVKVLAWYDNETAFSQRMIDLTRYLGKSLG